MDSTAKIKPTQKVFQGLRKFYHVLASSVFPLLYLYPPFSLDETGSRRLLLGLLAAGFTVSFLLDVLRLAHKPFNSRFMRFFSLVVRQSEENRFNGSTFLCLAFFVVIFFFSRKVAVTAMLFLSLGDAAAELGGRYFGRLRIFQRSAEGTAAFFLVAFLTALVLWGNWRFALLGAAAGALVELFSFELDDNLTVPIGSALVLWLAFDVLHAL
jgi:dolichol kinase